MHCSLVQAVVAAATAVQVVAVDLSILLHRLHSLRTDNLLFKLVLVEMVASGADPVRQMVEPPQS
jgi:hypothetical protein